MRYSCMLYVLSGRVTSRDPPDGGNRSCAAKAVALTRCEKTRNALLVSRPVQHVMQGISCCADVMCRIVYTPAPGTLY